MSDLKYCQGSKCHLYKTQDRIKGTKPNKTYQTRRRSSFYYGGSNFCSLNCQNDWFEDYGTRAIDHFGRLEEPKHLIEENAWHKSYDWRGGSDDRTHLYYFINSITDERRTITEEQYDDRSYTLNAN